MFNSKKESVLIILLLLALVFLPLIRAEPIDNSYNCLEDKVYGKCSSLGLEVQSFSLLALSYNYSFQSECLSPILASKDANNCWPKGSCKLKDTALAIIALNSISQDTTASENWLLLKKIKAGDLEWYLEIDSSSQTSCDILSVSRSETIKITQSADKKLSGNTGSCLELTYNNYWLKINQECLDETFRVSCDKDFLSTLLYKAPASSVWYITNNPQISSPGATTEHSIKFFCFGSPCDYEGSLWATLALKQTKHSEVSEFLPYLKAFAEDNKQFFPYAFLYKIGASELLDEINNLRDITYLYQKDKIGGEKTTYYYTALALLALGDAASQTKNELIRIIQNKPFEQSCFGSIRDTAFILWAGFPRTPLSPPSPCADINGFCLTQSECAATRGSVLNGICQSGVCCSDKQLNLKTCSEASGFICAEGTSCNGTLMRANDTSQCCMGTPGACINLPGCVENNNFCLNSELECDIASGDLRAEFFCPEQKSCCSKSYTPANNCSQITENGKTGRFCSSGEICNGSSAMALDGLCCIGN